jgi:DinB superfamily
MRKSLAAAVLALTACGGFPLAAELTDTERQRLLAHLDMTAAWLVDEVSGLTPAQLEFRTAPEAWTIAQVLDHLNIVAPIYLQDLQAAVKQPAGDRRSSMDDADVLWYGIDRTRREKAIPGERTSGQSANLRDALATYGKHHDRLRQFITATRDDLRRHIVQRQGCDAYQWALLISTHEQRHILQIREIKGNPGFPSK